MLLCDMMVRQSLLRGQPQKLGYPKAAGRLAYVRRQIEINAAVGERIPSGNRLVLDDAVIASASQVLMSRPRSLRDCVAVLRMPWRSVFVEWREAARVAARRELGVAFDNGQETPLRFGFLLETGETGRSGSVRLCWSHLPYGRSGLETAYTSPFWFGFDLDRLGHPAELRRTGLSDRQRLESDLVRRWTKSPEDIAALEDLNYICTANGDGDAREMATMLAMSTPGSPEASPLEAAKRAYKQLEGDIAGEAMTFIAVTILLTARNGTEQRQGEDRTKLNRARAKRGETPLLEHVTVHMRLSKAERVQGASNAGADGKRNPPRAHMVSGHTVRRGDAIYWRREHARGLASGRPAAATRTVHVHP